MVAAETVVTFAASCTGVVVYTSTDVDSCSSRHFARSRSRQSSPLKLLVCHLSASQTRPSRFDIISTSCVALRPTRSHLVHRRCAPIVDGLVLPTSHHAFDSLEIRVLLFADVGQLDDNLNINLVVFHHYTVHLVQLLVCHSLHGSLPAVPLSAPQPAPSRSSLEPLLFWLLVPDCSCCF